MIQTRVIQKYCSTIEFVDEVLSSPTSIYVIDYEVHRLCPDLVSEGGDIFVLPKGEASKTEEVQKKLIDFLFEKKCTKDTTLIAVGGGSTLDLVGFVASIYMRGLSLTYVPTTLLAMVDASIGGKTAINTPFGKNLIGTFYPPKKVLICPMFLNTLSTEEKQNGVFEILKLALVYDSSLLDLAEDKWIYRAVLAKSQIVEKDPLDLGLRRILNFGHTVAHGLEAASSFQIPHGRAVAIGSVVEAFMSFKMGFLSERDFQTVLKIFDPYSLKLPKSYHRKIFLESLFLDKKNSNGQVRCVLLEKIGKAASFDGAYCKEVPFFILEEASAFMENRYG